MRRTPTLPLLACGLALLLSLPLRADNTASGGESKQVFDTLYAAKLKAVSSTPDRADDITLAKDMLTLAKKSTSQPALLALLCDSAHDLASKHADGFSTAVESQQLLADTVEEKLPAAREKLIALLTKQSATGKPDEREPAGEALINLLTVIGDEKTDKKQYAEAAADYRRAFTLAQQKKSPSLDEVKAKMEFALSRDRIMKRFALLQEKLLKDADPATAEEIVKLCLLELDAPVEAKPYLDRVKNELLKTVATLAASAIDQVNEEDALKLGEWYRTQVADLKSPQAGVALRRSHAYLTRFVALHATDDLAKTKATVLLEEVKAALVSSRPVGPAVILDIDVPATRLEANAVEVAEVKKGSTVKVTPLSGTWSGGGSRAGQFADWTGYSGKGGWMALGIKLDNAVTEFQQREAIELKAKQDGKLFLFCVDDKVAGNTGSIKVKVEIVRAAAKPVADVGEVFDFVKQFATGKAQSPPSHYKSVKEGANQWIHMHPLPNGENAGTFAVELPKIAKGNKIAFTFGTSVNAQSDDGVRFIVLVDGKEVFSHTQKGERPTEQSVDLTKFAGSTADITLKVNCVQSQGHDDSRWGNPVIKVTK